MSLEHGLVDAVRVALLLGLALAAMPLLRGASAATRRLVMALALGGALVLPAVSALAPAWRVGAHRFCAIRVLRKRNKNNISSKGFINTI